MNSLTRQRGYLLITAVVTLFLLATIAVLLAKDSALNAHTASDEMDAARAEYVARAGIQHALWQAANNACMGSVTIPTTMLGADSYSATVTGAAAGTFFTLSADQDAWIRSDDPDKNNDTASNHTRFESGKFEQVLTRFDLSALPVNAQINSAVAWFHLKAGKDHPEGVITVHEIAANWGETSVTWETFGGAYREEPTGIIPAQDAGDVWVAVNLTGLVQAWVNGQPNDGILFSSDAEGLHTEYDSSESADPPRLEVVVGSGTASPVQIQATGTLANGTDRTLSRPVVTAYQPADSHVIRPGSAASNDAEIWDQAPNNNYGDAAETWVSSASGDTTRSLLRFDLGEVPTGARILEANLSLYRQSGSGADQPVSAHRITNSWSEGSVTWNDRESGLNWDNAGGDFEPNPETTTPVGPGNQRYDWNITTLVQGWIDGSVPNHGVALVAAVNGMAGERFYTSDQGVFDRRPELSVRYACECGRPCTAPQGSGSLLLVRNRNNPTSVDTDNQSRLESWGYTVNLIDDWDSQATFDSAMASNDVVFISGASPFAVGNKLNNAPIGVVNTRGELNDELGIASGYSSPVGSQVNISDNSHYITAPFQTGNLDIYEESMGGLALSGGAPAGAAELANWGGNGTIIAVDQGGALSGGGTAAARRVLLPVSATSNMDWRYVTNDGLLLVQRAIAWAAGANLGSSGNVLMVVGNDGSLTTQENAKKALIESWGYTVNVIDEDDNQGTFDAAFAANDVVFVGEDVNASDVDSKLNDATIGVVIEETNLAVDLGFSSSIDWDSGTDFKINTAHYITQSTPQSATLLTTSESLAYLTGSISSELDLLGVHAGGTGIAALSPGAQLAGGGAAPARRVLLPWGGNNMDINHLSADGLTVFRRAIEWGAGAGCDSMTPLLLVVGDSLIPSSDDQERVDLLSSWCYAPTLIDASASQASFNAAATANDVIYVSEEVDHTQLLLKVKDQPVGVVSEERYQYSHLGFASSMGSSVSLSDIEITDIWHPITVGFDLGDLQVMSSNQPMQNLQGTLSPDLRQLGAHPSSGNPSLAVLDTGDGIWTGGAPVPDRRVFLPWGGDAFEFGQLNDDGKTIMRRAIDWAAGAAEPPATIILTTESSATLGGLTFTDEDIVQYDPGEDVAVLVLDGAAEGVNEAIDAVHVTPGGDILFSMDANTTFKGTPFAREDIIRYSPGAGTASMFLDGSTIMSGPGFKDLRAIYVKDDGNLLLISRYTTTIGGVTGSSADVFEYDPGADTATLIVDGATVGFTGQFDAVHELDNGNLLTSVYGSNIVGGNNYTAGDIIEFDHVNNTSSTYLDESMFAGAADVRAVQIYRGEMGSAGGGGGGGGGVSYVEKFNLFTIASSDTWQPVDLSVPGVPAGAVAEIAVVNSRTSNERWGGVRAYGSTLDRRFRLHEAESGGVDAVVMHVQTNENSWIEAYSDNTSDVTFRLLGYWTGATYVELFDSFSADDSNTWASHNFSSEGVGANQVAEVVIVNTSTSSERMAGLRPTGSGMQRRFIIHEAESGGVDTVSMMVETDASARAEIYAASESDIDFHVVGYWSTPPGTYTEHGGAHSQMTSSSSWQQWNLASFGVPADSVVQVVFTNDGDTAEQEMGVRATGSSQNRLLELQEAESGGSDNASMHVIVDGNSRIEAYSESGANDRYFYPVGWWVLN